jgi:hypothetical protein
MRAITGSPEPPQQKSTGEQKKLDAVAFSSGAIAT